MVIKYFNSSSRRLQKAQLRVARVADVLAKVTDGILSQGDDRLKFICRWSVDSVGKSIYIGGDPGWKTTVDAAEMMIQKFYGVGSASRDSETIESRLQRLEAIDSELRKSRSDLMPRMLSDLKYVIAYYKNEPLPELSGDTLLGNPNWQKHHGGGAFYSFDRSVLCLRPFHFYS